MVRSIFEMYINDQVLLLEQFLILRISTATEGDIYLYVNKDGNLMAGIYAPNFDSDARWNPAGIELPVQKP